MGEIVEAASSCQLATVVEPVGPVVLLKGDTEVGRAMPAVGPPGSAEMYAARDVFVSGSASVRLVYDGLGIRPERRRYLDWLNQELSNYQAVSVDKLRAWMPGLS